MPRSEWKQRQINCFSLFLICSRREAEVARKRPSVVVVPTTTENVLTGEDPGGVVLDRHGAQTVQVEPVRVGEREGEESVHGGLVVDALERLVHLAAAPKLGRVGSWNRFV